MKSWSWISLLSLTLTLSVPNVAFSHVGHGDEFQATGGIERVQVNPETDSLLGIMVTPITADAQSSSGVMIPRTALIEADGTKLVFVQYENFYEPVEVTTGVAEGELIEITEGLSMGEQLVTQGSLSLYAESRKTKTAQAESTSEPITPEADSQAMTSSEESGQTTLQPSQPTTAEPSGGFSLLTLVGIGGAGVVLVGGTWAAIANSSKK